MVVFSPGVDEALAPPSVLVSAAGGDPLERMLAAQRALGDELRRHFEALGRSLAREYRVVLALGSVLVGSDAGLQRVSYLFGPRGEVLGTQVQTHRTPAERALGLVRGETLAPIATPLGPVGLVSGADVEYPEVSRILCLQGATLLVHQATLEHFSEAMALSRLWREVQANQVFGVEAYTVGEGGRGRSAIHAPLEMVPDHTGFLARAPDDEKPAVVVADLDRDALRQVVEGYPIFALRNVAQYRRYFPAVYAEPGGGSVDDAHR